MSHGTALGVGPGVGLGLGLDVGGSASRWALAGADGAPLAQGALGPDCSAKTFAALRRVELREFGEYRTRRLVLEAWDRTTAGAGTLTPQEPTTC